MNKFLITLFTLIASVISMNAQALFYIPAGTNPKNAAVRVFYYSNGTLVYASSNENTSSVRSHIMENPNYFENLGKQKNGKVNRGFSGGWSTVYNLKFMRQNKGYNFYSQESFYNSLIGSDTRIYDYFAFSTDWNTLVMEPQSSNPQYWTRVDKSNFEISF